jgi:hypothetical protein
MLSGRSLLRDNVAWEFAFTTTSNITLLLPVQKKKFTYGWSIVLTFELGIPSTWQLLINSRLRNAPKFSASPKIDLVTHIVSVWMVIIGISVSMYLWIDRAHAPCSSDFWPWDSLALAQRTCTHRLGALWPGEYCFA